MSVIWLLILALSFSALLLIFKLGFLPLMSQRLLFFSTFNTHVIVILLLSSFLLDGLMWIDLVFAYWLLSFVLTLFWVYLIRIR